MAISELSFRNALVGSGWHSTYFRQVSLSSSLGKQLQAECHDYYKLVNGWVWFELQMCRRWQKEHLCEVWGLQSQQNWGYGKFNACIG